MISARCKTASTILHRYTIQFAHLILPPGTIGFFPPMGGSDNASPPATERHPVMTGPFLVFYVL
jgi:hypothetical protein